jgi:glutamyl endopeptidase
MNGTLTAGLPAAPCTCSGGSAERFVFGRDDRILTRNTTDAPFRYICNLEDNGWSMCSGTLVGPRTVLTAGHCIASGSPGTMRVIPGRNGPHEPLPATVAVRFLLFPGFSGCCNRTDIGLIHLRNPIGSRVGFWTRAYTRSRIDPIGRSISGNLPMAPGALPVNLSGYPADMPPTPRLGCRAGGACVHSQLGSPGRNRVECGTHQYRAFDKTIRVRNGMLEYLDDMCPGHSGSPVWVRRHPTMGGRVLVAVNSAQRSGPQAANLGVLLTPAHINWIVRNTI